MVGVAAKSPSPAPLHKQANNTGTVCRPPEHADVDEVEGAGGPELPPEGGGHRREEQAAADVADVAVVDVAGTHRPLLLAGGDGASSAHSEVPAQPILLA